jgi:FkbM family methyltransferase
MNFQKWFQRLPVPLRRHKVIKLFITVFPSSRRTELHFNGTAKLLADLADANVRSFFRAGVFEPEFFEIASPLIPDGGVFFDVGANFGWCSFGLFGQRPADQIRFFLFEANPSVLKCLQQSAILNPAGDFHLAHGCVLDKSGFSKLEFSADRTGDSYYSGPTTEGIPNIVLDQFIAEHQISKVDLLKMDIEGAEPFALDGAKASLSGGIIRAIYIEVLAEHLERQGRQPEEVISVLRESGFSIFWCKPQDFELFPQLKERSIRVRSKHGSFLVSPFERFSGVAHTDILALHRDAPLLGKLLKRLNASGPADTGACEVVI